MGREVRRVPANWEHPRNEHGNYIPLLGENYSKQASEWDEENAKWEQGLRSDYRGGWKPKSDDEKNMPFSEWDGERPTAERYMPEWSDAERTHLQMYEDTTEGTPISPVIDSPENLARWLVDNNASAFGGMTANYEQWLATINREWAPSMVFTGGQLQSGVAATQQ